MYNSVSGFRYFYRVPAFGWMTKIYYVSFIRYYHHSTTLTHIPFVLACSFGSYIAWHVVAGNT